LHVAREAKSRETYGEVVQRLEDVVRRLEGGELSLEDSLKAFEEGIGLVRRGERLLGEAEKRIEQLLVDGGEERAVPLEAAAPGAGLLAARPVKAPSAAPASAAPASTPSAPSVPPAAGGAVAEEDVPF
jgi:exodeoxyribonuclease VII small subunit